MEAGRVRPQRVQRGRDLGRLPAVRRNGVLSAVNSAAPVARTSRVWPSPRADTPRSPSSESDLHRNCSTRRSRWRASTGRSTSTHLLCRALCRRRPSTALEHVASRPPHQRARRADNPRVRGVLEVSLAGRVRRDLYREGSRRSAPTPRRFGVSWHRDGFGTGGRARSKPGSRLLLRDEFTEGLDLKRTWKLSSEGPFTATDGVVVTSSSGLRIASAGTNPVTNEPAFTDRGVIADQNDHVKWMAVTQ